MVAQTVELPNLKKLFLPDPGYVICDSDLAQADAQVVAWEANDEELKQIFRDPTADLHDENAKAIFGKLTKYNRDMAKRGVHATNYGATFRTLATSLGITRHSAEHFQKRWFAAHPRIKLWHNKIELALQTTRSVSNKFGFRRFYFGRVETLLPEALAWVPQSTVALVINRGLINLDKYVPEVQYLLQIHDSLLYQVKADRLDALKPEIKKNLEITIPYDDPLIIPVGISVSETSWGDVEDIAW